jgi:hypothetical protein
MKNTKNGDLIFPMNLCKVSSGFSLYVPSGCCLWPVIEVQR